MSQSIPLSDVHDRLKELPRELAEAPHTVAITSAGKPVLAVMRWEDYQSVLETLQIIESKDLMHSLQQSIRDIAEERTVPWETVRVSIDE